MGPASGPPSRKGQAHNDPRGIDRPRFWSQRDQGRTKDASLEESVNDVVKRFGGDFSIESGVNWRRFLTAFKSRGKIAHLTMYGLQVDEVVPRMLPLDYDLLIVVGAEKVPPEVYQAADFNISVGNQPHSEVAALAILLDRLAQGQGILKGVRGGQHQGASL